MHPFFFLINILLTSAQSILEAFVSDDTSCVKGSALPKCGKPETPYKYLEDALSDISDSIGKGGQAPGEIKIFLMKEVNYIGFENPGRVMSFFADADAPLNISIQPLSPLRIARVIFMTICIDMRVKGTFSIKDLQIEEQIPREPSTGATSEFLRALQNLYESANNERYFLILDAIIASVVIENTVFLKLKSRDKANNFVYTALIGTMGKSQVHSITFSNSKFIECFFPKGLVFLPTQSSLSILVLNTCEVIRYNPDLLYIDWQDQIMFQPNKSASSFASLYGFCFFLRAANVLILGSYFNESSLHLFADMSNITVEGSVFRGYSKLFHVDPHIIVLHLFCNLTVRSSQFTNFYFRDKYEKFYDSIGENLDTTNISYTLYHGAIQQGLIEVKAFGKVIMEGVVFENFEIFRSEIRTLGLILINFESSGLFAHMSFNNFKVWEETIKESQKVGRINSGIYGVYKTYIAMFDFSIKKINVVSNYLMDIISVALSSTLYLRDGRFEEIFMRSLASLPVIEGKVNYMLSNMEKLSLIEVTMNLIAISLITSFQNNNLTIEGSDFKKINCLYACAGLFASENNVSITASRFHSVSTNFFSGLWASGSWNQLRLINIVAEKIKGMNGGIFYIYKKNHIYIERSEFYEMRAQTQAGFGNLTDASGGFFFADTNNNIVMNDSYAEDLGAPKFGAFGYMMEGNTIKIIRSVIITVESERGGLIYADFRNLIVLEGSSFEDCFSTVGGFIFLAEQNNLISKNTKFYNMSATYGGALIAFYTNEIKIFNSSFSESWCNNGSIFYLLKYENRLVLNQSGFKNQRSYNRGGAIYLHTSNTLVIDGFNVHYSSGEVFDTILTSHFNNKIRVLNSDVYGFDDTGVISAFYIERNNELDISKCLLSNFRAGVLFADKQNKISINGSLFRSHTIRISDGILKLLDENEFICTHSQFVNNTETIIGGVLNGQSNNTIVFNNTQHVYITSLMTGGAFFVQFNNSFTCENSLFSQIYNVFGGGIVMTAVLNNFINFTRCKIAGDFGPIRTFVTDPWPAIIFLDVGNNFILEKCEVILNPEALNSLQFFYSKIDNHMRMKATFFSSLKLQYVFYLYFDSFLVVSDSKFVENWVRRPVIWSRYSRVSIENSFFISNHNFDINSTLFLFTSSHATLSNVTLRGWIKYLKVFKFLYSTVSFKRSQANFCNKKLPVHSPPVNLAEQPFIETYFLYSFFSKVSMSEFHLSCFKTSMVYGPMVYVYSQLEMSRSLVAFNSAAAGFGGCFLISESKETKIYTSLFLGNKAYGGGVAALFNFGKVSFEENKFEFNQGRINAVLLDKEIAAIKGMEGYIGTLRGKGGAFYIGDSREKLSSFLKIERNVFSKNKASIGAIAFTRNTPFDEKYIVSKNKIVKNKALSFGQTLGSNIVLVNVPERNSSVETIDIETRLLRNQSSPLCLLQFIGYDNYSQIADDTEEVSWDLSLPLEAENIATQEKENITLLITMKRGHLCLQGAATSNLRVLSSSLRAKIRSKDLAKKARLINSTDFILTLHFRNCTQGEKFVPETLSCEPCPPFFYSFLKNFDDPNTCYRCYGMPFHCYGGDSLSPKPGFWRSNSKSTNFLKCPNVNSCLGDPLGPVDAVGNDVWNPYSEYYSTGPCLKGYTGVLCAECVLSYGDVGGYRCASCEDPFFYIMLVVKILLKILVVSYSADKALNLCRSLEKRDGNLDIVKANFLIKVFLQHMQALMILTSFPFEWNLKSFIVIDITLGFVTPDLGQTFTTECLVKGGTLGLKNVYFQLILSTLFPFFIIGLVLFYNVLKRNRGERKYQRLRREVEVSKTISFLMGRSGQRLDSSRNNTSSINHNSHSHSHSPNSPEPKRTRSITIKQYLKREISFESITLIVLSIYYIDILKMCTEMFSFISVGGEGEKIFRVKADMSIDFLSPSHSHWRFILALPIICAVGLCLPAYIFYRLYTQKKKGELHKNKDFLFKFGYFFYAYDERYYYYDFIFLIRRLVLMMLQVFFVDLIKFYYKLNSTFYITILTIILGISLFLHMRLSPFNSKTFGVINRAESYSLISLLNSYYLGTLWLINFREEETELGEPIWSNPLVSTFVFILIGVVNLTFLIYWTKAFLKHGDLQLEQKWRTFTGALSKMRTWFSDLKHHRKFVRKSDSRSSSTRKNAAKFSGIISHTEAVESPGHKNLSYFARHSIGGNKPSELRKKSSSIAAEDSPDEAFKKDFKLSERVKKKESLATEVEGSPGFDQLTDVQERLRLLKKENSQLKFLLKKSNSCALLNKLLLKELSYWRAVGARSSPEQADSFSHNHTFISNKKKIECLIHETRENSEEAAQRDSSTSGGLQQVFSFFPDERRDREDTSDPETLRPVLDINVRKIRHGRDVNSELQFLKLSFLIMNRTESHIKGITASVKPVLGLITEAEPSDQELAPFGSLHLKVLVRLTQFLDPLECPIVLSVQGNLHNERAPFSQKREIVLDFDHLFKFDVRSSETEAHSDLENRISAENATEVPNPSAGQALSLNISEVNFEHLERFLRRMDININKRETRFIIHSLFEDTSLSVRISLDKMLMQIFYLKRGDHRRAKSMSSPTSGCGDSILLNYLRRTFLPFN